MILMAVAIMFAMVGCKKERTCNCTTTTKAPYISPQVVTTTTTIKGGKCSDLNNTTESSYGGYTATVTMECEEK